MIRTEATPGEGATVPISARFPVPVAEKPGLALLLGLVLEAPLVGLDIAFGESAVLVPRRPQGCAARPPPPRGC